MADFLSDTLDALKDRFLSQGDIRRENRALDIKEQDVNSQIAERDRARREKINTRFKDIGNVLYDAFLEPDEATRNTVIDAIAAEVEQLRGRPLNKTFVNWMRKNPEDGAQVLENAARNGMTPAALFELQDDPVLLSSGLLAMGKAKREREARRVRGDGGGPASTPSGPSEQGTPGGSGIRLGGVQAEDAFQSTGGQSPSAEPMETPGDDMGLRQRINALTSRITALAGMGRDEKEIKPLREERTELEKQLFQLTASGTIKGSETAATEGEKPVPPEELREAASSHPNLRAKLRVGMKRKDFDKLFASQQPTATTAPVSAPTQIESAPIDAAESPATAVGGVRTPTEKLTEETRATERVKGDEKLAFEELDSLRKNTDEARKRKQPLELLLALHDQAGPTGAYVGPIRQSFFNIAQLLGAKPRNLDLSTLMETANLTLSIQDLKDFSGPDSDRDVMNAILKNPGIRKTETANRVLTMLALDEIRYKEQKTANANRWHGLYGSLAAKDPATGKTFQQTWDEYTAKRPGRISKELIDKLGLRAKKAK